MRTVTQWCCRIVLMGSLLLSLPGYGVENKDKEMTDTPKAPSLQKADAPQSDLLKMTIEPLKQIFSSHEGLVILFKWTAKNPVTLCLARDFLSQTQISISRSGRGKLSLQPLIVHDNSTIFQEPMQVYHLKTGDSITRRANLKRYHFDDGENWVPGEYTVEATFNLCEQTLAEPITDPGQESTIRATRPGWFMIMI